MYTNSRATYGGWLDIDGTQYSNNVNLDNVTVTNGQVLTYGGAINIEGNNNIVFVSGLMLDNQATVSS